MFGKTLLVLKPRGREIKRIEFLGKTSKVIEKGYQVVEFV